MVVKNIDPHKAQLASLRAQMSKLTEELQQMREASGKSVVEANQDQYIQSLQQELEVAIILMNINHHHIHT